MSVQQYSSVNISIVVVLHSTPKDHRLVHLYPIMDLLQQATASAAPAVFRGLNSHWPAITTWAGSTGLTHLAQVAGAVPVQVMYAHSNEFFGDFEHHQEVTCSFGQLLQQAQQVLQQPDVQPVNATHLYLAQQPLQGSGLSVLLPDVPVPQVLQHKQVTSVNMWFSSRHSRSSLHYDPYENLLCVVTGSKRVRLYPPGCTLGLYPRPLGGEASNHSAVNFAHPDMQAHPLYSHVLQQGIEVDLHPGDALYIPEGWWHQVDSAGMTFAVNFWWESQLSSLLKAQPHQHHYYLRQLLTATSHEAVQQLLSSITPWQPTDQQETSSAAEVVASTAQLANSRAAAEEDANGRSTAAYGREAAAAASKSTATAACDDDDTDGQKVSKHPLNPALLDGFEQAALAELLHACTNSAQQQGDEEQQQAAQQAAQQDSSRPHPPQELLSQGSHHPQQLHLHLHQQQQPLQVTTAGEPPAPGPAHWHRPQLCEADAPTGLLTDAAWWRHQVSAQQQLLAQAVASPARWCKNTAKQPAGATLRESEQAQELQRQRQEQQLAGPSARRSDGPPWQHEAASSDDVLGLCDAVTRVLAALQPDQLMRVLWVAASQHRDDMCDLLLHLLGPAAAQLLTQGLEAADGLFAADNQAEHEVVVSSDPAHHGSGQDRQSPQHQQGQSAGSRALPAHWTRRMFYDTLYGCVPDPADVLHVLLQQQTELAAAAMDVVLCGQLGRHTAD